MSSRKDSLWLSKPKRMSSRKNSYRYFMRNLIYRSLHSIWDQHHNLDPGKLALAPDVSGFRDDVVQVLRDDMISFMHDS